MSLQYFESEMKMPLMVLPLRGILVRENSKAILISPTKMTDSEIQKIKSEGGLTDIVAPSLFHHLYVKDAKETFPQATVWGVEGLANKNKKVKWDKTVTRKDWPYSDFLEVVEGKGVPKLNEAVFFHKKSRTLIVTDLCFNLKHPKGFFDFIPLMILGTYKRFAVSKLILKFMKDKDALQKSFEEILKWDFDRIVMSHGEILESGGKEKLLAALKERGFSV